MLLYQGVISAGSSSRFDAFYAQYAYARVAGIYLLHGRADMAEAVMVQATKKYPQSGRLWAFRAISDFRLHRQKLALTEAQKAKVLFPDESTYQLYRLIAQNREFDYRTL
jgi:Flp pilus assembly protein TadD